MSFSKIPHHRAFDHSKGWCHCTWQVLVRETLGSLPLEIFPHFCGGNRKNGLPFCSWYTGDILKQKIVFFGGGCFFGGYLVNTPPTPWKIHSMHLKWPIHGYTVIPCKWPIHENWVFYNQIHELVTSDDPLNLPGSNWDRLLGKNVEVKQLGTKNPWRILFTPGN